MSIAEKLKTIADNEQKVFDAGRDTEWNAFWDSFQSNGRRTDYRQAFARWPDEIFYPKYDIILNASGNYVFGGARIANLKQRLIDCGVTLDLSACTTVSEFFAYNTYLTHLPALDLSMCKGMTYLASGCTSLVSIDNILCGQSGQSWSNAFSSCPSLTEIRFDGSEITGNINFSACPLSADSIRSIIPALSETTSGTTVTFKKTAVNTAFGINVDDATTWGEGTEFYELRHAKDNWTFSFA